MRVRMILRTNKYLGNHLLSLTAYETFHNKSHLYFDTQPQILKHLATSKSISSKLLFKVHLIFFPICFREKIQMKK